MAEVTISHFREFPESRRVVFTSLVKKVVANLVYNVDASTDILPPNGITVITHNLGVDSETDASSGTEVKVALDAEEWPTDDIGQRLDPEIVCERDAALAKDIGVLLIGGVMGNPDAVVNVWVQQFAATGWYEGE